MHIRGMALVIAAAALVAVAAQAAAQDVSYNATPGADFAKFRTYRWVNVENGQQADQITDRMIRAAIDAEPAKKGLKMTVATDAKSVEKMMKNYPPPKKK